MQHWLDVHVAGARVTGRACNIGWFYMLQAHVLQAVHGILAGFTCCRCTCYRPYMQHWLGLHLIIIIKKVGSTRLGESDIHLISPKTPAPQYQPIDRKKRKGKRVEDYSRDRAA